MQENSGGPPSRDNQARGYNQNLRIPNNYRHPDIRQELVIQTISQPQQVVLNHPIQEGSEDIGTARFNLPNVDADGFPSINLPVDITNHIQSNSHGEQHPVQASSSLPAQHSPVVPNEGSEVPLHQGNHPRQPAREREEWQQQDTPTFGVELRSGRYTSTSDINQDHPLGFSGANMNAQSSRHLTNLPSESINQLQNFHPEVHENCAERMMIPEPANGTLQAQYDSKWWKCYGSFLKAGYDDNTAKHYADQLLSFLDIGEAVKCLHCGERGEMGKQFHHHASCAVSLYQQALRQEWQGQLGPNDSGNNERTVDQRPSAVPAPLASGLSSSSQTASNQEPSTQCLGAVGGVPNSPLYARGSNDGTCTQGNNLRTWNNGQDMTRQGPFLPPRASEMMAPSVSGLSLNPLRSNHVPLTQSLGAIGGPQRTGSNQRPYASAYVDETRVKGSGGARMPFTHDAAGPDTSSLGYQTAENGDRSLSRRGDIQRNSAQGSTSEFQPIPISVECKMNEIGFSPQNLQQAWREYQSGGGNTTNVDIELLSDIILKQAEKKRVKNLTPAMHSTGSYQSVPNLNERSGQSSHGSEKMDASICAACNLDEVKVAQYKCGHVVCRECAPHYKGDPCKICKKTVERLGAIDGSVYKKNH